MTEPAGAPAGPAAGATGADGATGASGMEGVVGGVGGAGGRADAARDAPAADVPPATDAARALFGTELASVERYAALLASVGVTHGHLGPREVPRLWDRHLANSAVVTDLLPEGAVVVDVGSGAGLPGIPMALRRPDLSVVLLEPMLRRSQFLTDTVETLGIADRVRVVRGRAEEREVRRTIGGASWVTARAVAPLERLLTWCLPLLTPGGRVLALKGSGASAEVQQFRTAASARTNADVAAIEVLELGGDYGMETTHVIRVERSSRAEPRRRRSQ